MSTIINQWEEIQTRENIMVLLDSVAMPWFSARREAILLCVMCKKKKRISHNVF